MSSTVLISVIPGLVPMNPATAVAFLLAGAALGLLWREGASSRNRLIGRVAALAAALVGVAKLGEYVLGWNIPIDQVLFHEKLLAVAYAPNQMAVNTAANFVLIGLALLLMDVETRRGVRPSQFLALAAAVVCLLAMSGYAYHAFSFSHAGAPIPMALHSAVTFAALSAGILVARPQRGVMAVLTSAGAGGRTARRLLFAAVGIPLGLGWLRLLGQRAGLYGTEYGTTLFAVALMVVLSVVIWWNARWLEQSEVQRRKAEEERERFFTVALDLMCIAGIDGRFKRLNPAWEQTLGYTIEDLLARPFLDFVHPEDVASTAAEVQKLAAGQNTFSFENRYRCKDGSYRWLMWNAAISPDRQLIYAAARDITERKRAEEKIRDLNGVLAEHNAQLHATNRELEAFSYSVSHDLRAPLRSIDGFSQALLEDYAEKLDGEGHDSLKRVRSASQRMGQLIDDLLNLSRVTRMEMSREPVNLSGLARSIVDELRKSDPQRQVQVVIADGLTADADPRLLRVVLDNLLRNAWKFTGKSANARIEFGSFDKDGSQAYYVRDNGVGFDMAFAGKLFAAFQRLHAMTEFPGTGVGLATVQRIVHRHGGRVWAEGEIGRGATFSFALRPDRFSTLKEAVVPQSAKEVSHGR